MKDTVVWTPEGAAALAETRERTPLAIGDLPAQIAKAVKTQSPWWTKGLPKSDAVGKKAIALAQKWTPKTKLDVTQAALVASLLGSYETETVRPFVAHILATKGAAFALQMSSLAWRYKTHYHNPGWPKNERGCAVWLTETSRDDFDSSVSYGKNRIAAYLCAVSARDPQRAAEFRVALDEIDDDLWPAAIGPAICISRDPARARAFLSQLISGKAECGFADYLLAQICDDAKLAIKAAKKLPLSPTLSLLDVFGPAILPLYDAALDHKDTDKIARTRFLGELQNVRGSKTARIFARYVTMASQKPQVVAYFKRYPELLDDVLADPKCADDHDYLAPLKSTR